MEAGLEKMRRMLILLIVVALFCAVAVGYQRLLCEQNNNTVELVADFRAFSQFISTDFSALDLLAQLKRLGIDSAALTEWTLGEKIALSDARVELPSVLPQDLPDLLAEPVGFNPAEIEAVLAAGMKVVPRLESNQLLEITAADKLGSLPVHLVIFNGETVPNIPKEMGVNIGLVEFTNQKGLASIATAENSIRVHGINAHELEVLSFDRIISRYIRAVRERNVRVLYLRPLAGENGWERSVELIKRLTAELSARGYKVGRAEPFPMWQPSRIALWVISLGIIAGASLLLLKWVDVEPEWMFVIFLLSSAASWLVLGSRTILAQQILALAAAVVFPTLAVVEIEFNSRVGRQFLWTASWSAVGLLLIIGILSSTEYLVKLTEFRGVKIMHLAPVVLVFVMSLLEAKLPLRSRDELKQLVSRVYNASIPVKYLLLLAVCAVVGAVYVLRTANFTLPIPKLETAVREGLEQLFTVRPRFKEIFIGHPALVLLLTVRKRNPILMSLAVIGQLSIVNTFTHIHTPIIISVIRTVNGLIIGYAVGWVFSLVYRQWKEERGR